MAGWVWAWVALLGSAAATGVFYADDGRSRTVAKSLPLQFQPPPLPEQA